MTGTSLDKHETGHDVATTEHGGAVVSYNPDAPSEEWGWHGHWSDFAPRGRFLMLMLGVAGLLLMQIGNHEGNTENIFLVATAAVIVFWMVRTQVARRRRKRIKP